MTYQEKYQIKRGTIADAFALVKNKSCIVCGGDLNCPIEFMKGLENAAPKLKEVLIYRDATNTFPYNTMPGMGEHILSTSCFFGKDLSKGIGMGNSSFMPSDLNCYAQNILYHHAPDTVVVVASPMDSDGNFQMSLCDMWDGDCLEYAIKNKKTIILEVNPNVPIVDGAPKVNIDNVALLIEVDYPFTEIHPLNPNETELKVARNVRSLLKDGDCIQVGIGALPNAILKACMDLNDLGMHTEMLTTQMGKMVKAGIINGKRKNFNNEQHIFTFVGGTEELFEIIRGTKGFKMVPSSYGVDPFTIMKNENMVSINTCIEVDLTGQVCSESIGPRQISGSGGALCYAYGAFRSKGGRGIIAFSSMTPKGQSKINTLLSPGAIVTIPRNYVDYIVTEYGIAELRGRNIRERAKALIEIAHPSVRDKLTEDAKSLNYI